MEQKVRIFEAFAGYGYNAIHGEVKNWGDVTAIDWHLVPDFDLLTWSSPCQDISTAGKGKGMTEGSGTRSSLLWEVKKPIEVKRPKYLLFENVKNFIGKNNRADAMRLFSMLEAYGYTVFYKVMNAKDYGVPQNRERIFILAIDGVASYEFPKGFPLERRLKDVLEDNVDERYYLSEKMISCFIKRTEVAKEKGNGFRFTPTNGAGIAKAITTCAGNRTEDNYIFEPQVLKKKRTEYEKSVRKEYEAGNIKESRHNMTEMQPREDGISNTLTSVQKDNLLLEKKILSYSRDSNGEVVDRHVRDVSGTIHTKEGSCGNTAQFVLEPRIEQVANLVTGKGEFDNPMRGRVYSPEGLSPTLTGHTGGNLEPKFIQRPRVRNKGGEHELSPTIDSSAFPDNNLLLDEFKVRKLTPRECFRLMDMDDKYIDRIQEAGISNSRQYNLAGNSIVVACLYWIFKNLFIGYEKTTLF